MMLTRKKSSLHKPKIPMAIALAF